MYLFLLEQVHGADYDEAEGFVVSAPGVREARTLAASKAGDEGPAVWMSTTNTSCNCLGISYLTEKILLRAFNAG